MNNTREREIRAEVEASGFGLVGLSYDRETFFIVKRLEREGFLDYCGRDTGRIIVTRAQEVHA